MNQICSGTIPNGHDYFTNWAKRNSFTIDKISYIFHTENRTFLTMTESRSETPNLLPPKKKKRQKIIMNLNKKGLFIESNEKFIPHPPRPHHRWQC